MTAATAAARAPLDSASARRAARTLVERLAREAPGALDAAGVDISSAVEQVFFSELRAVGCPPSPSSSRLRTALRPPGAWIEALRPQTRAAAADVMVLLSVGVHRELFRPVLAALARRDPAIAVTQVTAGRAARVARLRDLARISAQLPTPSALATLRTLGSDGRIRRAMDGTQALGEDSAQHLRATASDTIVRLRLEASRLDATMARIRPRAVVAYDEIDAWGRLLAAVAHRRGVPAVDLPHAEAVDVEAIRGVGYDLMGVYGPRAAAVLQAAGVPPERIAVVGAARFDALVDAPRQEMTHPRRILLAGQFLGGRMTEEVRAGILESTLAAAGAVGPARVEVLPHPAEPASGWRALVAAAALRAPGLDVSVEAGARLHDLLPGAALLVTGWSNSVYEAVLAGVPAVTIHLLEGEPPMPFAAEGIAAEARTPGEAAGLARELTSVGAREAALARARSALTAHLGALDGGATERTAGLVARAVAG